MTVEKVLEELKNIEKFNREKIDKLYRMDKEIGRKMYGSVKLFNEAKARWVGKTRQIEDLITWLEHHSLK